MRRSALMSPFLTARCARRTSAGSSSIRRIIGLVKLYISYREEERRPMSHIGLSPDAPTMPTENTLARCQPDARPGEILFGVQALEGTEEPVSILRVEAHAVIADMIHDSLAAHRT